MEKTQALKDADALQERGVHETTNVENGIQKRAVRAEMEKGIIIGR